MGWQRRILRVDLTAGTSTVEPLNMEWANAYLGERGLATKYLMETMDPSVDALSPENVLIFATGPLTGTMASTSGRYAVVTKGPLTGAIACSNSGGKFGAELKFAGYDLLIVHGRSPKPVYLHIVDDEVERIGETTHRSALPEEYRYGNKLVRYSPEPLDPEPEPRGGEDDKAVEPGRRRGAKKSRWPAGMQAHGCFTPALSYRARFRGCGPSGAGGPALDGLLVDRHNRLAWSGRQPPRQSGAAPDRTTPRRRSTRTHRPSHGATG